MSRLGSHSFSGAFGLEKEDLLQEALADEKKSDSKKVIFIIKGPNGRIVWLERGDAFGEF